MNETEPSTAAAPQAAPPRLWPRLLAPMLVLLVIVAGVSFLLAKGSSKPTLPGGVQQTSPGSGFLGTLTLPARPAPAIDLRNYQGQPVTLAQYRGKAVLVTFLYANCPDVCPLIASNLRVALNMLGARASSAQVIAVSVDPRGDTSAAVARFLRVHEMTGRMQYLIGSPRALAHTWAAWDVGSTREVNQPQLVSHSALVYGVSASGRLTTVYPDTFEPSEIAHDVPKLAAR
ncbi:MAG TPA: SCO family protein [Solirubrobacteraceae bacterium]|jgi:protein SCO1/2|nr:SCO family protein [Solirubrobacteraceae bacterium]